MSAHVASMLHRCDGTPQHSCTSDCCAHEAHEGNGVGAMSTGIHSFPEKSSALGLDRERSPGHGYFVMTWNSSDRLVLLGQAVHGESLAGNRSDANGSPTGFNQGRLQMNSVMADRPWPGRQTTSRGTRAN